MTTVAEPKINQTLLAKVMEQVEHEMKTAPRLRRWQQQTWRSTVAAMAGLRRPTQEQACGTAMCFAGWAIELDRRSKWAITSPMLKKHPELQRSDFLQYVLANDEEIGHNWFQTGDILGNEVQLVFARDRATRLLGLTETSASLLFSGSNHIRTVRRYVKILQTGRQLEWSDS